MKSKDIVGHESKFFNIFFLYGMQYFCAKVWVLSKVLVVKLKILKLVVKLLLMHPSPVGNVNVSQRPIFEKNSCCFC
jgi:hypothetical protein